MNTTRRRLESRHWLGKTLAGTILGLGLALALSGLFAWLSPGGIAADPGKAQAMFGKEGLYGGAVASLLDQHLDSISGTLVLRTESINKQISGLEDELDRLDVKMERLSEQYTRQFTAMETMIVQMQSSASSLNSLLAQSE